MDFDEVLDKVVELLQREQRVSYRALKRRFELDDEYIENLKAELIDAKELAVDKDGKVLVWMGGTTVPSSFQPPAPRAADSGLRTPDSKSQTLDARPRTLDSAAERRQLTVMFCDLVGSTALSEQLDPEELRELVHAYQATCAGVIHRYEGHIAQYLGDGLLVYFGYPVAHEDDTPRAVRAGLDIVGALPATPLPPNAELPQSLQVRIGIHTGLVVVWEIGGGGEREQLALGETPNIAARVQGKAEPNTVVISAATYRLVAGLFECQDRGPHTLHGVTTPLPLYRVVRESEAQSRFEVAVGTGLTPLVGRDFELGLLQERWARAKGGDGQVVLLNGEPGIGKSRLVQALKEQVMAEGATRIEFRGSPYHQNSAFYPIIAHLQRFLQFRHEEGSQEKLTKLQQALSRYRFPQADTVALVAALLSLPQPTDAPPLALSPQKQKQKTQEILVAWIMEEAEQRAVYNVWEDLHWADPSTLELLTLFLDQVPLTRVLALLTFRPDFIPPWRPRSHITQLTLNRLGRQPVETMVETITGGKPLPREVLQQIVIKTDGVPLFVEELTKMVLESGLVRETDEHYELTGPLPPLAIPSTLQDSLMARLDRLTTTREIAQLGAALGREFSYDLLHAVSPLDEGILQQGLQQLVDAELLYQRGVPPQATYFFKHALVQDTAYQSLLKSTRQQFHQQIAQALEQRFHETVEIQPELLAHHYTEAGLIMQAIPYWEQAGQKAVQHSANVEAVSHLTRGLELLKALPDTPERARQELALQIALGAPLIAAKGYAAPELEQAYGRALSLCRQVGETPQLFPAQWGLAVFYMIRAEHQTAHGLAEQLLHLAQSEQDPALFLAAHFVMGVTSFFMGEIVPARAHLEQAIARYAAQQHRALAFLYGADLGVTSLSCRAWALWHLGYPDQALRRAHGALALARELGHPFSLGMALTHTAWLHQLRREGSATQELAEAAMTLATEQGFPFWAAESASMRGWALAEQGRGEEGIAQLWQGLAAWRAVGAGVFQVAFQVLLAEAYGQVGQASQGLSTLAETLEIVKRTGERYYEAEVYRLKGELLLAQEGPRLQAIGHREKTEEAEVCFLKAIEVARQQQAKFRTACNSEPGPAAATAINTGRLTQHATRNTQQA
jgi:class 3 adenylate cyclase/predicted ATPase